MQATQYLRQTSTNRVMGSIRPNPVRKGEMRHGIVRNIHYLIPQIGRSEQKLLTVLLYIAVASKAEAGQFITDKAE